jgi:hypothetical protein
LRAAGCCAALPCFISRCRGAGGPAAGKEGPKRQAARSGNGAQRRRPRSRALGLCRLPSSRPLTLKSWWRQGWTADEAAIAAAFWLLNRTKYEGVELKTSARARASATSCSRRAASLRRPSTRSAQASWRLAAPRPAPGRHARFAASSRASAASLAAVAEGQNIPASVLGRPKRGVAGCRRHAQQTGRGCAQRRGAARRGALCAARAPCADRIRTVCASGLQSPGSQTPAQPARRQAAGQRGGG